ncbi:MAG: HAD-IA family hydrolase [Oscillospiraceae bacterium]|nr:HAD-IA family hydrolase [Oscillospiraceae bacterium]
MNRYKLAVFDLDGTLVDSLADLGNACNKVLADNRFPIHGIDDYRFMVGNGMRKLIERALPEGEKTAENIERLLAQMNDTYRGAYNIHTRPYEGITELLDRLAQSGIKTAVASNKPDEFTKTIVHEMLGDRFTYISGQKDTYEKKPAPGIILHIMDKLGVSGEETVMIGDSCVDMQCAANAGIDSIGCTWGFRPVSELKENNATYLADTPLDIYDILTDPGKEDRMKAKDVHLQYIEEGFDENSVVNKFELHLPDNFNYAYDIVDAIADLEPDRRALIWCDDEGHERIFTYGELKRLSNRAANLFTDRGIKFGDHVMCVLKRHWQMWIIVLALEKIGAVLVPVTNMLKKKDYIYRFKEGSIRAIVATGDGDVSANVEAATAEAPLDFMFMCKGEKEGWIPFDSLLMQYPDTFDRVPTNVDDDCLMFFSSGTTGYPKMVMHSHRYGASHIPTAKYWHHLNEYSIHFTIAESGWGKFFWGKFYGQFAVAATVMAYDFTKFKPADVLKIIEKYKVTSLCAPATIYRFFIKEGMGGYDISSLQYACTAGEAINAEVFNKFREATGLHLMEGFGQTETVLVIGNPYNTKTRSGSMGKAMPMFDVVIVDPDGKELPPNEVGEICIRLKKDGPNNGLFKGYVNNPEANAKAFSNGLYHTGDTARRDEDGYFWYVGRVDDVIKSSGYRIGPFEIESVLMEHPAVLECAITAAPDPVRGQVVKATIVLTQKYRAQVGEALAKELQNYVKTNTAPYKYPRIVEFVDELPKTISGKIRRVEIRQKDGINK